MTATLDIIELTLAEPATWPVARSEGYQTAMFGNDSSDIFSCPYTPGSTAAKQWQDGYDAGAKDWR